MFTCQTCSGRSFVDAQALQMHKQSKHPSHHKCKACDRHFPSVEALEQHSSAKHPVLYDCKRCSRQFTSSQALEQHDSTKHAVLYDCKRCSHQFLSPQALEQHNSDKHSGYHCHICNRDFGSLEATEQHKNAKHASTRNCYNCYLCGREFQSKEAFQSHGAAKHPPTTHTLNHTLQSSMGLENQALQASPLVYQCTGCGLTLQSLEALELHRLYGHLSRHGCHICGQEFYSLEALDLHTKAGHPQPQTRETCMQEHESIDDDLTQRTLANHICNCRICHRELQSLQAPAHDTGTRHSARYEHSVSDRDAGTPESLKQHLETNGLETSDIDFSKSCNDPGQDDSDHSPLVSCYNSFDEELPARADIEEHEVVPSSPNSHCSDWDEHIASTRPLPTYQPLHVKDQYLGPAFPGFEEWFHQDSMQELGEHTNEQFTCTKCELLFLDISWYHDHCAEYHTDRYCPSCHWQFDTAEALQHHYRHFASHPKCEGCDVGFVDNKTYLLHLSNHGSTLSVERVPPESCPSEQTVAFAIEHCQNQEASATKFVSVSVDQHDYDSEYATDEDADHDSHIEHLHASVSSHNLDSVMLQRLDRRLESSRTSLDKGESHINLGDTSPLLYATETHSPVLRRSESPIHLQHFPCDNSGTFRFEAKSPRRISISPLESSGMLDDGSLGKNFASHSNSTTVNDPELQHTFFLPQEGDDREDGGLSLQDITFNYEADHRARSRPSSVASSGRLSDEFEGLSSPSSPETSIILISKESLPKHIRSGQAYLVATSARSIGSQSPISSNSGSLLLSSTLSPSHSAMSLYDHQGKHSEMSSSHLSRGTDQGDCIDMKQESECFGKPNMNEASTSSRASDGHALRFHCRLCQMDPCEDTTVTMCGHLFCNKCITREIIATSACPVCKAATLLYCLFRLDLST